MHRNRQVRALGTAYNRRPSATALSNGLRRDGSRWTPTGFAHPRPSSCPRLLSALEHADLVIGSRWVPGGKLVDWPPLARGPSRGGRNLYTRLALGIRHPRRNRGGFRAYPARRVPRRRSTTRTVVVGGVLLPDRSGLGAPFRAGFRVAEVPITFLPRREPGRVRRVDGSIVRERAFRASWPNGASPHRGRTATAAWVNRDR